MIGGYECIGSDVTVQVTDDMRRSSGKLIEFNDVMELNSHAKRVRQSVRQ